MLCDSASNDMTQFAIPFGYTKSDQKKLVSIFGIKL